MSWISNTAAALKYEVPRVVTDGEINSIDTHKKKSDAVNVNEHTVFTNSVKVTKVDKRIYTFTTCLETIIDGMLQKSGQDSIYCNGQCQS